MNWRHLFFASAFASSALPFAQAASAQVYATPQLYLAPVEAVVEPIVIRTAVPPRSFELFNNSQQDILYLHLYTDSQPEDAAVYGGTRRLRPGRAWSVSLGRECSYNIMAEYEDGSQVSYVGVNTCDYRGMQLQ